MKILCVDDEKIILKFYSLMFKQIKYSVEKFFYAENGKDAIDLLHKENPDVILLDLCLPDMNGIDILKIVKEFNPKIQVIVITGTATIESAVNAMKLGAYDYLQKPIDTTIIQTKLNNITSIIAKDKFIEEELYSREVTEDNMTELMQTMELKCFDYSEANKFCLNIIEQNDINEKEKLELIKEKIKKLG